MQAMLLTEVTDLTKNQRPLVLEEFSTPEPGPGEILVRVTTCGVCHTELDEIEGRTPPPVFPVIPGHQVVGEVIEQGDDTHRYRPGDQVGIAWIYSSCGECEYCRSGNENLCPGFRATGRDVHGGYAEYMTVPEAFAYPIPDGLTDGEAAPLLCAGAIGYRSLRLTQLEHGESLGLTGFGASGHLVLKMVRHRFPSSDVYVFARNPDEREFARELGAVWAGETEAEAPKRLHAIIDTTPAWKPVVEALKNLRPGGRLVINAIRKEAGDQEYLLKLDWPTHLWMEKEVKSVANVARRDVEEFLQLAGEIPLKPDVEEYPLDEANTALVELKEGKIRGAKVLRIND